MLGLAFQGLSSFNPRTHEGCDAFHILPSLRLLCFNPRTHEGCDNTMHIRCNTIKRFNPRTHEGCDYPYSSLLISSKVSIHAPTRGATKEFMPDGKRTKSFQSTHPRGVRLQPLKRKKTKPRVSIHAPTRGATKTSVSYAN